MRRLCTFDQKRISGWRLESRVKKLRRLPRTENLAAGHRRLAPFLCRLVTRSSVAGKSPKKARWPRTETRSPDGPSATLLLAARQTTTTADTIKRKPRCPKKGYATNKFGRNSSISSSSEGACSTQLSVVSNSVSQTGQCQICVACPALTISDHSGTVSGVPHLTHSVETRNASVAAISQSPLNYCSIIQMCFLEDVLTKIN